MSADKTRRAAEQSWASHRYKARREAAARHTRRMAQCDPATFDNEIEVVPGLVSSSIGLVPTALALLAASRPDLYRKAHPAVIAEYGFLVGPIPCGGLIAPTTGPDTILDAWPSYVPISPDFARSLFEVMRKGVNRTKQRVHISDPRAEFVMACAANGVITLADASQVVEGDSFADLDALPPTWDKPAPTGTPPR